MTPEHLPITIVGGGLGGLTLARVLAVNGIDAVVLESEPSRQSRVQGGMLDIHTETGQDALRAAQLFDAFRALVHPGGEAMRIVDRSGTVFREEPDQGTFDRPEIDRGQLRDLLLDALPRRRSGGARRSPKPNRRTARPVDTSCASSTARPTPPTC